MEVVARKVGEDEEEWLDEAFKRRPWPLRWLSLLLSSVLCCGCGALDGLRLYRTAIFLLTSSLIQKRTAQCLTLNGGIFLASVMLGEWVLSPLLCWLLRVEASSPLSAWSPSLQSPSVVFLSAYYLLWVYPMYGLSFVLSSLWYQDIADATFAARRSSVQQMSAYRPVAATFKRWVAVMSEELYRLLLVLIFVVQLTCLSYVPYGVGGALAFIHLCWLHSLYSFDYKWSHLGWRLELRLSFFERRWSYFLGFGAPAAALMAFTPRLYGAAIFSATFPLLIILAVTATPRPAQRTPTGPTACLAPTSLEALTRPTFRLPLFYLAQRANLLLLTRLRRWQLRQLQLNDSNTQQSYPPLPSTPPHAAADAREHSGDERHSTDRRPPPPSLPLPPTSTEPAMKAGPRSREAEEKGKAGGRSGQTRGVPSGVDEEANGRGLNGLSHRRGPRASSQHSTHTTASPPSIVHRPPAWP